MLRASYCKYTLHFKRPSRTSREVLTAKDTYFVKVWDSAVPEVVGIGEVALFRGLSADDTPEFETMLGAVCRDIANTDIASVPSSAIRMGMETALSDLANGCRMIPFSTAERFEIPINGLVWMADRDTMMAEARAKIDAGFRCVKLKIGGIEFERECEIIAAIRREFPRERLQIRLDANGAFTADNVMQRLETLAAYDIHSLEQPVKAGQTKLMARVCHDSPIDIALDEELIGITPDEVKRQMLSYIRPGYIILKPTLCGGFREADKWIATAADLGIGWWSTSALESNVGLNAIARHLLKYNIDMPQGLGTGRLYTNNIPSPLTMLPGGYIATTDRQWTLTAIK